MSDRSTGRQGRAGMRIAIVGAGGIGGFLGMRLAGAGHEVHLLARGAYLEAIRAHGLSLVSGGTRETAPLAAHAEAGAIGPADLVILAVKGQDLPGAIDAAAPLLVGGGLALPFQNGVDAPRLLAEAAGPARALIGVAQVFANITAPGEVTHFGGGRFIIGDLDGGQSSDGAGRIAAAFRAAGVDSPAREDVRVDLWMKFLLFNAVSGTTAAARGRLGDVRAHPALSGLFADLVAETEAVARAEGVPLPGDALARTLEAAAELPDTARASTAHDLEQGKSLEIDWIAGAVVRMGQALGVPTPASAAVHAVLAPWRAGRG